MEVDSPARAAVEIMDNADNNRSKGGPGVKINDNIMQVFVSTTFLLL
jgi:hypothetical protein